MIKVELHAHTDADIADRIPFSATDLIDRAAAMGYGAIAITLHDRWTDPAPFQEHAASRGVVLLAGIERTVQRKHVLLINAPRESERVQSFADVAALRRATGTLVVAPHPFYPIPSALGHLMDEHAEIIDAVEINAMHAAGVNFNRRAIRWARAHGKPLVGNSDLHLLGQLGTTYSLVDASEATPEGICNAIREGKVEAVTEPLAWIRAAVFFTRMMIGGIGARSR